MRKAIKIHKFNLDVIRCLDLVRRIT